MKLIKVFFNLETLILDFENVNLEQEQKQNLLKFLKNLNKLSKLKNLTLNMLNVKLTDADVDDIRKILFKFNQNNFYF